MADTDPVRIVVEIVDDFSDELAELRSKLEEIDMKRIDPDFDLDDGGDIEAIRAQIRALMQELEAMEADLDVEMDDGDKAEIMLEKEILSSDMTSTLNIDTELNRGFLNRARMRRITSVGQEALGGELSTPSLPDNMLDRDFRRSARSPPLMGRMMPDIGDGDFVDARMLRRGVFEQMADAADTAEDEMRGLGKNLKKYLPSMNTWYNLIAVFVPVMGSLAVAALGVAAAFGAVAVAAGGILGLGLLGWGENLQKNMQNLQQQARQLQKELFGVLQPATRTFQPMLEDWMEGAPHQVERVVDELQQLTVFEPLLEDLGAGFIGWLEEAIIAITSMSDEIGQLVRRFSRLIGQAAIELFQGLVNEAYKNQDAYIKLGEILIDVGMIIFRVFKAVSFAVAAFKPFFDIALALSSLLSNEFVVALGVAIASLFILETALAAVFATTAALSGAGGIAGLATVLTTRLLPTLHATVIVLWEMWTALSAIQKALVATGIGALAVAGGWLVSEAMTQNTPPANQGSGSSGGDTYINVQGDVGRREADRIMNAVPGEARKEYETQQAQEK